MAHRPKVRNKWLSLWQAALGQELGLCIRTTEPRAVRANLENARRQTKGTEYLLHLYLRLSPANPTGELWIINPPQAEEGEDPSALDAELEALLMSGTVQRTASVDDDGEVQW